MSIFFAAFALNEDNVYMIIGSVKKKMHHENLLSGTVICGSDFEPVEGYICIRDGLIKEVVEGEGSVDAELEGIIAPRFVNAHTHIGDSVFKDPPLKSLDDLVRPPDGLKHKILKETAFEKLVNAMRITTGDMIDTGTCAFIDFREGGTAGIRAIKKALEGSGVDSIYSLVLGRNTAGYGNKEGYGNKIDLPVRESIYREIDAVLDECDGLGISSTNDLNKAVISKMADISKAKGKKFAIHAGEKDCSDIEDALNLEPDFLVHLVHAGKKHLRMVADQGIPVVVCPRSNFVTGSGMAPIADMLDCGITVAVGTDNVMLNSVNMFSEMEFISKIFVHDDRQVFKMCTLNGAKISGMEKEIGSIEQGKKARVMVINKESKNMYGLKNPLSSIVRRARPDDIRGIY